MTMASKNTSSKKKAKKKTTKKVTKAAPKKVPIKKKATKESTLIAKANPMTLDVIRKEKLKQFGALDLPKCKQVLKALNHIEHLGTMTRVDLSELDILEVFKGEGESKIELSLEKISQIFMGHFEEAKKIDTTLPAEFEAQIKKLSEHIGKVNKRITFDLLKEVKLVQDAGFWKLESVNTDSLTFATRNQVIGPHPSDAGTYPIEKDREHTLVNFGKFKVTLSLVNRGLSWETLEDNIETGDEHPHPHMFNYGICWGGAAHTATSALSSGELSKTLQLLAHVLTFVNETGNYWYTTNCVYEKRLRQLVP